MCSNLKATFSNIFKKSNIIKIISFFFSILVVIYLLREKNHNYTNLELVNQNYPNYINNIGIAYLKTLVIAVIIILLIKPYFKDNRLDIISWFYPFVISILGAVFFKDIAKTYLNYKVDKIFFNPLGIIILIGIFSFSIYNFYLYLKNIKKYKLSDYLLSIFFFTLLFIFLLPLFVLRNYLFSLADGSNIILGLKLSFLIYAIILIGLYFSISCKNKRKIILLSMILVSLALFLNNTSFKMIFSFKNAPITISSILAVLYLYLFIKKRNKLFNILYFASFTLFALIIFPTISSDNLNDIINNSYKAFWVLTTIFLFVFFNIYKVPKGKEILSSFIAFSIYYAVIVFINSVFLNFDSGVDYLYLNSYRLENKMFFLKNTKRFNHDFIYYFLDYNGSGLIKFTLRFNHLFLILVYITIILLNLLSHLIVSFLYKVANNYYFIKDKIKKLKIDKVVLYENINDKIREEIKMATPSIEIKNFSKKYIKNDFYSVKNLNYTATSGKVVGIVGHNGAGKSTLIKSLVGIQNVTSGVIKVCGFNIYKNPTEAKYVLGYVSDNHALYEELTGREYITFVAKLYNVEKNILDERLKDLSEFFNIAKHIDREIRTYSHGMKQKISIISSLIHDPKVWVLDEPLTGLDPTSSYQLKQKIKEHAKKGNIVIFSSHIIEVVENLCDEIVIIKKGEMVLNDTMKNIKSKNINLEQMYIDIIKNAS